MIFLHEEVVENELTGTIIDFETIGQIHGSLEDVLPVIFGFINKDALEIYYVEEQFHVSELLKIIDRELDNMQGELWAFNKSFEQGLIHVHLNRDIKFRELHSWKYESKRSAEAEYGIPNFNDPFFGHGELMEENFPHNIKDCVRHNRACLLKETEIWKHRFSRRPLEFQLQ